MNYEKYLIAAGVPTELHAEAITALERARNQNKAVSPYKWSAPLVMAWVVPRLTWITWSMLRWKGE